MVHNLLRSQFRDNWEDTASVAAKKDNVGWVTRRDARNLGIADVFNWVRSTSVLSQSCIIVINKTSLRVEDNVLKDGSKSDGIVNIGLLLGRKVHAFGVAL